MEPDIEAAFGAVNKKVALTAIGSSKYLTDHNIEHALVGALAVGAYGYPRATTDVDFLIRNKFYTITKGGFFIPKVPLPMEGYSTVKVDYVDTPEADIVRDDGIDRAKWSSAGIPVAPAEVVAYMKVSSPRLKDRADIVEWIKKGLPINSVRKFLTKVDPKSVKVFNSLVKKAAGEY